MKRRDTVTAICWVILGLIISIWSATFPFGSLGNIGPGWFPFSCGLILILLGSILFFQDRKRKKGEPMETFIPLIPHGEAFNRFALSLGGMLLSALLFDFLGFVLTMFCLNLLMIRAVEPKKWTDTLFYTLIFTLSSYMLFQFLLKTNLPRGVLGF
jgi:hypothetical protein